MTDDSGQWSVVSDQLQFNADGLIPAVAQQHDTGEVLMLAWMNRAALEETLATGRVCYYSRSRQALWRKGDTSGHVQRLVELRIDCDEDTILLLVEQTGAACHTGRRSCFFRTVRNGELVEVAEPIVAPEDLYPGDRTEHGGQPLGNATENTSVVGKDVRIVVADPWDFVTMNGSFFSGKIISVQESSIKPFKIEILFAKPLIYNKNSITRMYASPRHVIQKHSILFGPRSAYNFCETGIDEAKNGNFDDTLKLLGSIEFA